MQAGAFPDREGPLCGVTAVTQVEVRVGSGTGNAPSAPGSDVSPLTDDQDGHGVTRPSDLVPSTMPTPDKVTTQSGPILRPPPPGARFTGSADRGEPDGVQGLPAGLCSPQSFS